MTADRDRILSADDDELVRRRVRAGLVTGILVCTSVALWAEVPRLAGPGGSGVTWLFDMNVDTTPFAVLLLLVPLFWLPRSPLLARVPGWLSAVGRWLAEGPASEGTAERGGAVVRGLRVLPGVLLIAVVAAILCLRVAATEIGGTGKSLAELPPGFHDEFSYLFQAQTYLAGRFAFPGHPEVPRMFDQMHVLNEGRFASRYFPGTGAWLAPFLAAGCVYMSAWVATVAACVLVFLAGRELSCNGTGMVAGLLAAASPGINLFGNTLLAHPPTLLGLSLFLWQFLKLMRRTTGAGDHPADSTMESGGSGTSLQPARHAVLAGIALAFAMLCRPMTAAGFALPFGIWAVVWAGRQFRTRKTLVLAVAVGLAAPLAAGFGVIAASNLSITGSVLRTPYQVYTELLTPRHMYGFNNVVRGEELLSSRVLDQYDRWARNLDAGLAVTNVWHRLLASWQWTLSVMALLLSLSVYVTGGWKLLNSRWWLVGAAIVSLHVVHVPYWYDGILHWHYVFETGVLWCLMAAAATQLINRFSRVARRRWILVWWLLVLTASVAVNQAALSPFWDVSRLEVGINQFAFPRARYELFRQMLQRYVTDRPALVLVRHDPSDRHLDFVSNHPSLTGDVLTGRLPMDSQATEEDTIAAARRAFPERSIYVFDVASGRLSLAVAAESAG